MFLLCGISVSAQYKDYNAKINLAESFIIEEEFSKALNQYRKCFSSFNKPFAKDLDNALNCAVKAKDFKTCSDITKKLLAIGCNVDFFRKQKSLSDFVKSKEWFKLLESSVYFQTQYYKNNNWALRAKIEELIARDQSWRNLDPHYTTLKDSTFNEDNHIMEELLSIMENEYPDEYEIGVFLRSDTIIAYSPLNIILLHNYSNNKDYKEGIDLTEVLIKHVEAMHMPVDVFAYLNDRSGEYKMGNGFGREGLVWLLDGEYCFEIMEDDWKAQMNKRRKEFGMEDLDLSRKKVLFEHTKDSSFHFFHDTPLFSASMPEAIVKKFFQKFDLSSP